MAGSIASTLPGPVASRRVPLFSWFILRRLRLEALRSALTVAGVALGVAVVLAIRLANASALGGFSAALDAVAGKTSLEVIGVGLGVDEPRLAGLGWLREWGDVSPVIESEAMALVSDARAEAVRVLGVDVLRDQPFREYRLLDLGAATGTDTAQGLLGLLVEPTSIIVTERFARRHGLEVAPIEARAACGRDLSPAPRACLRLAIGDRVQTFTIRGLLRDEGPARVVDGNFALMDIAAAQLAFDRLGRVDRVDVRLADPSRLDEAERAITAKLPPGLSVQRPARRGEQVEQMLAAFQFNLSALSYVALLVGLFLVYNTVATSVIARREEIGMLRALGASRRRVLTLFLGEGALLSLAGCALGIPLGALLARAAVAFTSSTVTTLYVARAAGVPSLTAWDAMVALAIGVPLALAAAAAPAHEAARVSPLRAVRGQPDEIVDARTRRWSLAGVACLMLAAVLSQAGPVNGLPIFGFVAAVLVVFGLAALVPAALTAWVRLAAGPASRWLGVEARLAQANITSALPRVSVSVAALAVSLSMLVAIAVMIGSFRETVIYWVGQTLQADLYVATARRSNLEAHSTISPELERAIAGDRAVAAVDRFRALSVPFRDRLIVLGSGDFRVLLAHGGLVFKAPGDGRAALASAIGRDAVVISEALSLRFGVAVGETIALPTPSGPRDFEVSAVYYDYSTDRGVAVVDRGTFIRHFGDQRPTSLSVYLRAGVEPDAVRERLMAELGSSHRLFVHSNASLRAEVLRIFDATFAITYGLEAVAIVVAVLGITATLVTLILERRRELAVLRLIGADLAQVRRMIVFEAGLLGLASQLLGGLAGLLLSLLLIYVINVQSFGWTIQFHLPVLFLAQAMALVLAATMVAGLYPARLAAGFRPADEMAVE
jgi:putative ABC transport system permease protein